MSRAKSHGVDVLALTDHDTIDGVARAMLQGQKDGIIVIPGIEFSTQWQGRGIHLLGLNFDLSDERLVHLIHQQSNAREQRAKLIAAKLESVGIVGSLSGARQYSQSGASLGRPHFAQFLVAEGHAKSTKHAFQRFLGAGKVGDIKQNWPEFEPVISAVNAAGGTAVLAHPAKYAMTRTKLCAMVERFKACGGAGMELLSGKQAPDKTQDLCQIALRFGLLGSCGSDFHAPGQPWQELGAFGVMPNTITPIWSEWRTH